MGLFDLIFGKKEQPSTVKIDPPEPVLSGIDIQPKPIVLSGNNTWAPVNLQPSSGVIIMKPSPLVLPFTTDLVYLDPRMRKDFPAFNQKVLDAGLAMQITCVARLYKTQVALYAQGRQPLAEINRLRQLAGLGEINSIDARKIVTWTLVSKHLVNYDDNDPNNDYSQAIDFVLLVGKKANWDIKVSVNKNKIPDYEEVGEIGESFGWEWGGRWKKSPDYPHLQLRG